MAETNRQREISERVKLTWIRSSQRDFLEMGIWDFLNIEGNTVSFAHGEISAKYVSKGIVEIYESKNNEKIYTCSERGEFELFLKRILESKNLHADAPAVIEQWVIVCGDLGSGVQGVEGPFKSEEEASNYAEIFNLGHFEKFAYKLNVNARY